MKRFHFWKWKKDCKPLCGIDLNDFSIFSQNLIVSFGPTDASQASELPSDSKAGDFLFKCYSLDMAMSDWIGNAACSKLSNISPSSP